MRTDEQQLLETLASGDTVALLSKLVAVPSLVGHEGPLADVIGEFLEGIGFEVRIQGVDGSRKNILGTLRYAAPGPCLMFNGHLDTVAPTDGWTMDPYCATRREDRLYGLGALDMKGGIAAALAALEAIVRSKLPLRGTLMFSGVIDEEGYSDGARALLDAGLDGVDAVIIGEPCAGTRENPVPVLTPGKVLYRLTVQGVQAHGFRPQDGVNALEEAARVIASLDRLRQTQHETLGKGPVSTLKLSGGYEEYAVVVPDHCEAIISRMIAPGETSEGCRQDLEELIDSLHLAAETTVEMIPPYYAPLETNTDHDLFRAFEGAYRDEHGRAPTYGPSVIITDASVFDGLGGIPTLVCGPAGGGIHQADEYVDLASLAACARTYARTAARFLGPDTDRAPAHD